MAIFLFIDESGHDRKEAPYEVLAGVSVKDRDLWELVTTLHDAEIKHFGMRYSAGIRELKGRELLKRKVFQHAGLNVGVPDAERQALAKFALECGAEAGVQHLRALALAKLAYVKEVFETCQQFRCRAFASIVEREAPRPAGDGLRKDYGYLFERFFYFLEDEGTEATGIIVFDELGKSKSHLLIDQAYRYFKDTATGRHRAGRIVPEPLFVHSELTTGVQLADLTAYVVSWGFRTPMMTQPARPELEPFAQQVSRLRYRTTRDRQGNPNFEVWSFAHIGDLRTRQEREFE